MSRKCWRRPSGVETTALTIRLSSLIVVLQGALRGFDFWWGLPLRSALIVSRAVGLGTLIFFAMFQIDIPTS